MKVEEPVVLHGPIRSVLAGTMFQVELATRETVLAEFSGGCTSASSA
jgi:translation initiation factor IF-1